MFYKYLCMYPTDVFFRMANRFGRLSDGRYGEDTDAEIYGNGSVDLFSPWTGKRDLGDGDEKDSSLLHPSSDLFPVLHVPSVSPGVRHTAGSVPLVQTSSHTDTCISDTHIYVGRIETAGVNNNADWALNPFRHCPVHSTSWQAGCAVCDRALHFPPKVTADVPNFLATSVRSLKRESTEPTYTAELGLVGQEVARHVSHQKSESLTTGQASQFSLANLMVSPAQELKSGYDLQVEAFLQDFEKRRTFQQQLVYRGKLIGLLEGIRQSMTPLFSLTNELAGFEAKLKLFCGELGITLAQLDRNSGFRKGIGSHPQPVVIRQIGAGLDISVPLVNPADMLGGLGLPPDIHGRVWKRINQVHQANSGTVEAGLSRLQDSFRQVYDLSTKLAFATSEDLDIFFRLSGFHDDALGSLIRHKLLLLSEPIVRRADVRGARQIGVGLPVRDETVFHKSVQSRSSDGTIPGVFPSSTNDKPKSKKKFFSKKKASSKQTGNSGASLDQDGEALDAGWAQVMKNYRAAKKARVEKVKAGNAAKTDGASAAPQYSGEYSFWLFFCIRLLNDSLLELY